MNARLFEELRPVGFAVAYRMLGSVSEAEDIVQEAFLRLHHTLQDGERIESPRAYLSTVVTRLCINHLRSARARRETYVEALPEPLVGEPGAAVPLALATLAWPPADRPACFVCGPTAFAEAVANLLVDQGYAPERIKTERFGPSGT